MPQCGILMTSFTKRCQPPENSQSVAQGEESSSDVRFFQHEFIRGTKFSSKATASEVTRLHQGWQEVIVDISSCQLALVKWTCARSQDQHPRPDIGSPGMTSRAVQASLSEIHVWTKHGSLRLGEVSHGEPIIARTLYAQFPIPAETFLKAATVSSSSRTYLDDNALKEKSPNILLTVLKLRHGH